MTISNISVPFSLKMKMADRLKRPIMTGSSLRSPEEMVSLANDDPNNPANVSSARKWHIVCVGIIFTFNSALGSSLPSGAHAEIAEAFHLTSDAILGGLYSDIYHNPQQCGTAMACFMFMTTLGPQVGPTISGFVSLVSGRWIFGVALIIAGVGLPIALLLQETFVPVLVQRRDKRLEKTAWAPVTSSTSPVNKKGAGSIAREIATIFSRSFVMTVREPIMLSLRFILL
ncbi:hypothetical protein B0J14DRAFT_691135 [Halenospora varia]|nr:hypothetical protein B0J14DRAFT_691135 [Halenospora varia]